MSHRTPHLKSILFFLVALTCVSAPISIAQAALTVQSYSPQKHWRFYNGPGKDFIGAAYDSSGVGRSPTGNWAVMISEHYFVTANHAPPVNPIRFRSTNNINDPGEDHQLATFYQQIGSSDLSLGRLLNSPSAAIKRYPILNLPSASDYDDLEIYTYGKDSNGFTDPTLTQRLGRNNIDIGSIQNLTNDPFFSFSFDNPGLGADESIVNQGDSGAPSFAIIDGHFALVGLHYSKSPTASFDTFVPSFISELNAAMTNGEQVMTIVPEPTSMVMVTLGFSGLSLRRRRRLA